MVNNMVKIAVAVEANNGWDSPVAYRFARAPFFAIIDIQPGRTNLQIIPNPHAMGGRGVGPLVAQWLAGMGVQVIIAPHIGPNASAALSSLGIQIKISPPGTPLKQALIMHGFGGGF